MDEYEILEDSLKEIKELKDKAIKEKATINDYELNALILKVVNAYLIGLIGDYQKYLTYVDSFACFNENLFLSKKTEKYHNFYKEIIQGQNFINFLQNKPEEKYFFNKLIKFVTSKRSTNIDRESTSLLSIFTKKKLVKADLKDITIKKEETYSIPSFSRSSSTINLQSNKNLNSSYNNINNSIVKSNLICDSTLPYTNKHVFSSRDIKEINDNVNLESNNNTINENEVSSTSINLINLYSKKILNIPPFYVRNIKLEDEKLMYETLIKYKQSNCPNISENRIFDFFKFNDLNDIINEFDINDSFIRILISNNNDEIKFDRKKSRKETKNLFKTKLEYDEDDEIHEESINKLNNNEKLKELFKKTSTPGGVKKNLEK